MTYNDMSDAFFPRFPPEDLIRAASRMLAWLDRRQQRAALVRLDERRLVEFGAAHDEAAVEIRRCD